MGFKLPDLNEIVIPLTGLVLPTLIILLISFPLAFLFLCFITIGVLFATRNEISRVEAVDAFFKGYRLGGHRGSPHIYPENSMTGFIRAKEEGADLIEFDVALTKDKVAVLMHDDDLDRTTNMKGPIRDKMYSELANANIAANFVRTVPCDLPYVKDEKIPTLEEVVKWSVENKMRMLFDVKDTDSELVAIISELFEKYNLYGSSIVCSFFPHVIYRIKRGNQKIVAGLTWRRFFFSYHDLYAQQPRFTGFKHFFCLLCDYLYVPLLKTIVPWYIGADLLLTNRADISQYFVESQNRRGRRVAVWTVNDVAEMHWMLDELKIPVLTDHPYYFNRVRHLENIRRKNYLPE